MNGNCTRRWLLRSASMGLAVFTSVNGARLLASTTDAETLTLDGPGGRAISVTRWKPASKRGVILFSHGALSSPLYYDLLILPWVRAGYEVWAPLHVDSAQHPSRGSLAAQSWPLRIEDMRTLARHVGAEHYVAAGHSYGGLVALTLGGASPVRPTGIDGPLADRRVKAVVAYSPPGKMPGLVEDGGYATVAVPALIQTGTRDIPFMPGAAAPDPQAWRTHLLAYDEPAPGGDRYALVMEGVDHYFGGTICNFERPGPPQTAQATYAAEIGRIFMDAYGRNAATARTQLGRALTATGPAQLLRR